MSRRSPAALHLADLERPWPMPTPEPSMKAWTYRRYGGPEVLNLEEVETPTPDAGEVLVEIKAAAINAADYRMMRADPFLIRLMNGLFRPKKWPILGSDLAGVVVETGSDVTSFKPGDAVFGEAFPDGLGSFAEYKALREDHVAGLPSGMRMEEAAAVSLAGITAIQAVRDLAELAPGKSTLIQGAGGGVGTLLVQVAKAYGAQVTAVCGPKSLDLVRALGADRVLDYTKDDFVAEGTKYDAIFGVNGYRRLSEYKGALVPGGTYVVIGGKNKQFFDMMLKGRLVFAGSGKQAKILTIDKTKRVQDLAELRRMLGSGQLKPLVDRVFPFEELPQAMAQIERGHVRGKLVLTRG